MYVETAWSLLVCERNQWSVLSFWFFMRPDRWHQRQLTFDARTGQTAKAYNKLDLPDKSLRPNFDRIHAECRFQIQNYYSQFTCWFSFNFFDIFVLSHAVSVTAEGWVFAKDTKLVGFQKLDIAKFCYIHYF